MAHAPPVSSTICVPRTRSGDPRDEFRQRRRLKVSPRAATWLVTIRGRHHRPCETQLFRLFQALLGVCDWPYRPRKADFAEINAIGWKGKTGERRNQSCRNGKIRCRLGDPVAACDIEVDV